MTYIESIMRELEPIPASPLGPKPTASDEVEARQCEVRRLSLLLEENSEFSFLRLGDMDLCLLIADQEGRDSPEFLGPSTTATGTQPAGGPGISTKHALRLKHSLQNGNYVDFHQRLWPINVLLQRLKLSPDSAQQCNPDACTSYILLTWMEQEFKSFCEGKRVGFLGAEAGVLEILHRNPAFLEQAKNYWPVAGAQFFLQPRGNGSNLDANMDLIKADLIDFVRQNRIDTLFISLGGAAKILCYELAKELNIRCIDFGAMLRGLCYLGSDGNRVGRSTHSPFFYRLPFDLVMDAVEKTFPQLAPHELLAKAHAQVILDLQKKEVGWTSGSKELCVDAMNRSYFKRAYSRYLTRYAKLPKTPSVSLERKQFYYFCGVHKLTVVGFLYYFAVNVKGMLLKSK